VSKYTHLKPPCSYC